jgi:hypothetical protein
MLLVGITFVAGLIYFIPALLATACHHPRLMRVWGLNLLGFTVIGWVLALRETIYGVHNVYGKHSPEGSLLTQRFTLNRYFVLAVIGIGLVAVSITLGLHQLRPAPGAPVVTPVAAGDCPSSQVRFDDEPHSLSWDEANSPIYADRWKTASRVSITVDVATPAASSVAAQ